MEEIAIVFGMIDLVINVYETYIHNTCIFFLYQLQRREHFVVPCADGW